MVTRLIGGITPGDGSDPRTFPAIWNATADDIEQAEADIVSQGSAIVLVEDEVDSLQAGVVSLGTSTGGTASLDFTSGEVLRSHVISGGAVTITGSNYVPGSTRTLRLFDGTAVASLSLPPEWVFVGNAAGTAIGTATTVIVTATSFGTVASSVVAAYAEEA
jgi:hypothetical protein